MGIRIEANRWHRRAQFALGMALVTALFPLAALEVMLWLGPLLPGTALAALAEWCGTALFGALMPWMWVAFLSIVTPPALRLTWSLMRRLEATRRLGRQIAGICVTWPEYFGELVDRLSIRDQVRLIPARWADVRTVGLLHPIIVCTTGLLDTVSPAELEAILRHEAYHVRCRDPLKILLGRSILDGFFWLPATRTFLESFEGAKELAADAWAVLAGIPPEHLASALLKLVRRDEPRWGIAAAPFAGLVALRLTFLMEGRIAPPVPTIRWRHVVYTFASSAAVWGILLFSCAAVNGLR